MRWNRSKGGCIVGAITGSKCVYDDDDNLVTQCTKQEHPLYNELEKCKHKEADLQDFVTNKNACQTDVVPYDVMNHFLDATTIWKY